MTAADSAPWLGVDALPVNDGATLPLETNVFVPGLEIRRSLSVWLKLRSGSAGAVSTSNG